MNRLSALFMVAVLCGAQQGNADDATDLEFFEKKIRPVLIEKCYSCHSGKADEVEAKLWLDTKEGWARGGQSGPAIVPGKPEASLFLHAIRGTEKDLAMPPDEKLPDAVITDFETWIRQGAFDPRTSGTGRPTPAQQLTEREQWAYSVPTLPELPAVRNESWLRQPVDRFILSQLEEKSLTPAPIAAPEQLVRRLHFDLTGLPPTPDEVDRFVLAAETDRQQAVIAKVDELLSRPSYGEKWGRYWLDCVRYADSLDARASGGGDITDAWRYRDWVVDALNSDLPYRDFIRHQIAGDLLARQNWDSRLLIATGMYAIGNWGNGDSDKLKVHTDIVDDQIDVTSRAFLGLTLSCARCHDHKFDPLTTADYYAMAGFFFSSRILDRFAHPTAGESLMRIDLLSPEDQARRNALQMQIAELDTRLQQKLMPLTRRRNNVAGRPELVSWAPDKDDHPSLTVNLSEQPQNYSTISHPALAVSVHPSPKDAITIAWRSPVTADVTVSVLVEDIDKNCGDGVSWSIERGDRTLSRGDVANGGTPAQEIVTTSVQAGQLIRLVIAPRQTYFCDSTRVDLTVRLTEDGQTWNLTQQLLGDAADLHPEHSPFLICAGAGADLTADSAEQEALKQRRQELASQLPNVTTCQGLLDGGIPGTAYEGIHDAAIHVRGSYSRLASVQPRGFPALFRTEVPEFQGSGRLELADWIASRQNPLTARVLVNRLWQHHLGRGIVATANNFGKLGTPPTHPELLDWLAVTLMDRNWSLKEIHRIICTSATYQQASSISEETFQHDPDNLLFSRQSRRKLTAEELRDALLAVTGALDDTRGGPAVTELQSPRRTLYLKTVRSDRTTFQLLFDGADPTSIVEQRNDSLVAPQALWLLNQPFVLTQSKQLASDLLGESCESPEERLALLIKRLFSRVSDSEEIRTLMEFLKTHGETEGTWQVVCHVLICSNEFLFVD